MKLGKSGKIITNIVFILVFLWLFKNFFSWQALKQTLQLLTWPYIAVGFGCLCITYILRAHRFYVLLGTSKSGVSRLRWSFVFKVMLQHNAINNLMPFRLGELSFPLLLKKMAHVSLLTSAKTLITARLYDFLIMGTLSACVVLMVVAIDLTSFLGLLLVLAILAAISLAVALKTDILPFAHKIREYLSYIKMNGAVVATLSALIWLFKILGLAILLTPMLQTTLINSLISVLVVEGTAILPVNGPANFGSLEGISMAILVPLGLEADTIFSAILNLHLAIIMLAALGYILSLFISHDQPAQGENS